MIHTPLPWRPTPLLMLSILLHVGAAAVVVVDTYLWLWALGAVAANHVLLGMIGMWPRGQLLGPNLERLPPESAARGEVALTIDDGPDPNVTPRVLEILDAHGARATFFCIGRNVAAHPELAREIIRRGHALENHSDRHWWNFALLGVGGFVRELQAAQAKIAGVTGQTPYFFRAPAGVRSPLLDPALSHVGLRLASWTHRGFDTVESDPATVLKRLRRGLSGGAILLLHDGNAARTDAGEPVIVVVLPQLLEALRAAGLHPVTLRAAFGAPQVSTIGSAARA